MAMMDRRRSSGPLQDLFGGPLQIAVEGLL